MSQSGDGADANIESTRVPYNPPPEAGLLPSMMRHQAMNQAQVMTMKARCHKHGEEEKKR